MRGRSKETLLTEQAIGMIVHARKPITVRGICYALFTKGLIPDMSTNSTKRISRITTRMREDGEIDWRDIVDDSRIPARVTQWSEPDQIIEAATNNYRKDYWQDQPRIVEVWSEKSTVKGLLAPVLDEWGVTFRPFKGFGSFTAVMQAAVDSRAVEGDGKVLEVLYLGDHDPSGRYMSDVDLPERLSRYGAEVYVDRIAVDMDYDASLPSFAAKKTDKRYKWFVAEHGQKCIELDALNPNVLRERVNNAIRSYVDMESWARMVMVEEAEKESMRDFLTKWRAA